MKRTIFFTAVLAICVSSPSFAVEQNSRLSVSDILIDQELAERELALSLAVIRSEKDLTGYLNANRAETSAFNVLSVGAQSRFLRSLRFGENGLASFDYGDLRMELTPRQIYQLLSIFGVQRSTASIPGLKADSLIDKNILTIGRVGWPPGVIGLPIDYEDMACESRATCRRSVGAICIGDNC